ncbi:hypothetical protein NRF20_41090 [Streptomyces sp. R-74717]
MQEQDLDQHPGAVPVPGLVLGRGPERLMDLREPALRAGLREPGSAGERARLDQQDLQVVIQDVVVGVTARQARVARHHLAAVEHPQLVPPQLDPHLGPDELRRHRVVALAHRDPAVASDLGCQVDAAVEVVPRQRAEAVALSLEAEPDRGRPTVDVPGVLRDVDRSQALVQLRQRIDLRRRDQVLPAEPSALVLHAALLMRAGLARSAVER